MKRSAEREHFWQLVVDEHAGSGLTVREFCRREGVSEPSFYYWRRRMRERTKGEDSNRLVPVKVIDSVTPPSTGTEVACSAVADQSVDSNSRLELFLADNLIVRIDPSCSIEMMRRVLVASRLANRDRAIGKEPCNARSEGEVA